MTPLFPRVKVRLVGEDGNAHSIMGRTVRALKLSGCPRDITDLYLKEAKSGDYDNLLSTTLNWVDHESPFNGCHCFETEGFPYRSGRRPKRGDPSYFRLILLFNRMVKAVKLATGIEVTQDDDDSDSLYENGGDSIRLCFEERHREQLIQALESNKTWYELDGDDILLVEPGDLDSHPLEVLAAQG